MSRKPRMSSRSDIYHVVLRSVNQQTIFEEKEDYIFFLKSLKRSKEKSKCMVLAYCLMDNHIHLLVKTTDEPLSTFMERLTNSFVPKYNQKYNRSGHLFQGRFFSEPVETERYLLNSFRYILQNPVRAGIVSSPGEYFWSSYRAYLGKSDLITDTGEMTEFFASRKELCEFADSIITSEMLGKEKKWRGLTDQDALKVLIDLTGCNTAEFQMLAKEERNKYIKTLKKKGLTVRQISRITGYSKSLVSMIK